MPRPSRTSEASLVEVADPYDRCVCGNLRCEHEPDGGCRSIHCSCSEFEREKED